GRYPEAPRSYVLLNDGGGKFEDKTATIAPALLKVGMVTDAKWSDLDGDNNPELVIVGDWMPVSVFAYTDGELQNATSTYFDKEFAGWWNSLLIEDFDEDDIPEIIIGNMGLNTQVRASDETPASLYFDDFDGNGSVDPFLSFYIQGKEYPYVTRDELMAQMSNMRTRFPDYE